MVRHLHIKEFVPTGKYFYLSAPITITQSRPESLHDHDFHEIFFVEKGQGWHWMNGKKRSLTPGQLVLVRETDCHALTAEGQDLQLVNIAFSKPSWKQFLRRYFQASPDPMLLPVDQRTRAMALNDHHHLHQISLRASQCDRTRAHLDLFLIEVLWIWHRLIATPLDAAPIPPWLATALADIGQPHHLKGGTRALADLAGRSADHVARAAKRWLGQSPTQIVNSARMEHAARLLAGTDREILDIADDCGLANLAHFYKLFAARFGCTPRRYRLQQLRIVGQAMVPLPNVKSSIKCK